MRQLLGLAAAVVAAALVTHGAARAAEAPAPGALSFERTLQVSQWWTTGALQERLNAALRACGQDLQVPVTYKLGPKTGAAIARLRACPGFDVPGEAGRTDMTAGLWALLFPSTPPPTVAERIHILVLTFEATDYDVFLWNVGQPADPTAWGTWGPFGATLAHGAEIQKIIAAVDARAPGLVARAFEAAASAPDDFGPQPKWRAGYCAAQAATAAPRMTGYALLRSLGTPISAADKAALRAEFCDDAAYRVWYRAFRALGRDEIVRAAYDAHYADQNRRIVTGFARAYQRRGLPRTATDWAFFLDRATQFTTDMDRVAAAFDQLAPDASPAQRRLAISRAHRPKRDCPARADGICVGWSTRVGRDMAYVVDALGDAALTPEERAAWTGYGARRISALGLDDTVDVADAPYGGPPAP